MGEVQAVRELNQTMQDEIKALQGEVASLTEVQVAAPAPIGQGSGPWTSVHGPQQKHERVAHATKPGPFSPDAWLPWPEGSTPLSIPYSSKLTANFPPGVAHGTRLHCGTKPGGLQMVAPEVA